jgi:hypothetical protein
MRVRLHANAAGMSPERARAKLRRIQHRTVAVNGAQRVAGLSNISKEQTEILAALAIKKPTLKTQLTLL